MAKDSLTMKEEVDGRERYRDQRICIVGYAMEQCPASLLGVHDGRSSLAA